MGQDVNIEGSDRPPGESETSTGPVPDRIPPEGSLDAASSPAQVALPPAQEMPAPQSIQFGTATPAREGTNPPAATDAKPAAYQPPSAYPPAPGFGPPPGYGGAGYPTQPVYPPAPGYAPPGSYPPPPGFGPPPAPGPYERPPGFGPPNGSFGYWPGAWQPGSGPAYGQPGFGYGPPVWTPPIAAGPAPGLVWAGMSIRLAALVVDLVIELVVLVAGTAIAEAVGYHSYGPNAGYSPPATIILWVTLVLLVAYVPTSWWAFQGTIGQRALGLRVLRAADGLSLGLGATTIRYLVWLLCVWTVVIGIVVAIVASEKPDKRAWPDDASGSVVVRRA